MKNFYPDMYYESIYKIDYKKLKSNGIKCLIFDLDNTIVPIKAKKPNKELEELFSYLDTLGFKLIIMSNSPKKRVEPFKDSLNVDCSFSSLKPLKYKYKKIIKLYNLDVSNIACIGDQILTDIWGANKMGLTSIFVEKLRKEDFIWTYLNRLIENRILKYYHKKNMFTRGHYYD